MGSGMLNSMRWTRIVVLREVTGRTDNWIAAHRHHDCALVRSIRRKPSEDLSSIFQLEHGIGRLKVTNADIITRIKEITMTNHRMPSVAISQAIRDASEPPSISPTIVRLRPHSSEDGLPHDNGEYSTGLACRMAGSEHH
jgi:hypothetical protein